MKEKVDEMDNVGKFMFGVGALIQYKDTDEILVIKRAPAEQYTTFNDEKWELLYGRKAQNEEIEETLVREIREEVGMSDIAILRAIRIWHFYRGERKSENELIGVTFWCRTNEREVSLSLEHTDYKWVNSADALKLISVDGIKKDVEIFRDKKKELGIGFSPIDRNYRYL